MFISYEENLTRGIFPVKTVNFLKLGKEIASSLLISDLEYK